MSQLTGTELRRPRVCVLAPTPLLTIEIDPFDPRHPRNDSSTGRPPGDVHLHPGGQGLWVARMAASLGAEVTVCGPFGGEVGPLLITSLTSSNLTVRPVTYLGGNGAYVYDCSSGERRVAAHMVPAQLTRHELDDLYGTTLVEALDERGADHRCGTGPCGARQHPWPADRKSPRLNSSHVAASDALVCYEKND